VREGHVRDEEEDPRPKGDPGLHGPYTIRAYYAGDASLGTARTNSTLDPRLHRPICTKQTQIKGRRPTERATNYCTTYSSSIARSNTRLTISQSLSTLVSQLLTANLIPPLPLHVVPVT
jgi:hypothetical protein